MQAIRWLAAALVLAASPALAQDGTYKVGETGFVVPAPEGYCAGGKAVTAYLTQQRQVNPAMLPDVVMMRCSAVEISFDFYAVRVVRDGPPKTLAALLADLRRTLPAAQAQPSLVSPSAAEALNRQLSDALDIGVRLNAGIRPVGLDDVCGYVAGVIHAEVAGAATADMTAIGCVTVVGGRVIYLFRYAPGVDRAKAIAALPELKRLALAIGPEK